MNDARIHGSLGMGLGTCQHNKAYVAPGPFPSVSFLHQISCAEWEWGQSHVAIQFEFHLQLAARKEVRPFSLGVLAADGGIFESTDCKR
jgi:hypothetical protein